MRLILILAGLAATLGCSSDPVPSSPPPPVPTKTPRPAPIPPPMDERACEARVPHGTALGTWKADLGQGNSIELHAYMTTTVDAAPDHPEPGMEVVSWARVVVLSTEALLDVKPGKDVEDPGALCLTSVGRTGAVEAGSIRKDDRSTTIYDVTLQGQVPPALAAAMVGDLADADWIPWSDDIPGEAPYLHLRLGGDVQQGFPTALGRNDRLQGELVVALVDGHGKAVVHTAQAR